MRPLRLALLFALVALAAPASAAQIQRVVSAKGVVGWLVEDHSAPIVSLHFAFRDGAALDPADRAGLSRLASDLLDEGAGDMPSQAYQGRLEDLSIHLSFTAGLDTINGSVRSLTQHAAEAADLLHLALSAPRFDPPDVERVRGQLLAGLAREDKQPSVVANRTFFRAAFPDHPYARGSRGTLAGVHAVTEADLKAWARQRLTRDVLVTAAAGDLTPKAFGELLDRAFGTLAPTAPPELPRPEVPAIVPHAAGAVMLLEQPVAQSVAVYGEAGLSRNDPDWYAAALLTYILGGDGLTSRLADEVREKRGLAYSVSASLLSYEHAPLLFGGLGSANDRVAEALDIVKAEWARMRTAGPTEAELADAKTYLTGSFPLQMESTNGIAAVLLSIQLDHLPLDYLDHRSELFDRVTIEDARRVAARLFDAGALETVVVGKPKGVVATRPPPSG